MLEIQGRRFNLIRNATPDVSHIERVESGRGCCAASSPIGFSCTRPANHLPLPFLHIAGTERYIVAIWFSYDTVFNHEEVYRIARTFFPQLPSIQSLLGS